jgi:hypothetical protein
MKESVELNRVMTIEGDKYLNVEIEPDEVDFEIPEGYQFDDYELVLTVKFKKKKGN